MKPVLREVRRFPEFVRWRNPLLILLMVLRETLRPFMYWYIFDIFETDLRLPGPESYSKESFEVRIYGGNKDLKRAVEDLTCLDDLLPADIELRFSRGDVVAVAYAEDEAVGCMWLTFSTGMELGFGTSWILEATEALRYGAFVRPDWRGRALHSVLNNTLNRYAQERRILRTLSGISVFNSQSRRLHKRFRSARAMRVFLFRVRGVKWTYRKALGAPLESRFAVAPGFQSRSARSPMDAHRLWKIAAQLLSFQTSRRRESGTRS